MTDVQKRTKQLVKRNLNDMHLMQAINVTVGFSDRLYFSWWGKKLLSPFLVGAVYPLPAMEAEILHKFGKTAKFKKG